MLWFACKVLLESYRNPFVRCDVTSGRHDMNFKIHAAGSLTEQSCFYGLIQAELYLVRAHLVQRIRHPTGISLHPRESPSLTLPPKNFRAHKEACK